MYICLLIKFSYLFLFFSSRLATLPNGLDSNGTKLLANLLPKISAFYYLPIVSCKLVLIKIIIIITIIIIIK